LLLMVPSVIVSVCAIVTYHRPFCPDTDAKEAIFDYSSIFLAKRHGTAFAICAVATCFAPGNT
jgi:hypothetical protein